MSRKCAAAVSLAVWMSLCVATAASAAGDPQTGEAVFKKSCAVCHTVEPGKNKLGPNLHGIVGRHFASVPDYTYSEAMKKADKVWDEATLDTYLTSPRDGVPGTKMAFAGVKNDIERQDLIAYLAAQQ